MCQQIVLRRNGCWKHFSDKTVKSQTCQFMLYFWQCRKIYWV